jgi:hypothetical protein
VTNGSYYRNIFEHKIAIQWSSTYLFILNRLDDDLLRSEHVIVQLDHDKLNLPLLFDFFYCHVIVAYAVSIYRD